MIDFIIFLFKIIFLRRLLMFNYIRYLSMREIVTFFFGLGFVFNASLFIPQAIRILKTQSAKNISLITFAGFNFIQLNGVFYGSYQKDWILMYGNLISFVACGTVTLLAIYYRNK